MPRSVVFLEFLILSKSVAELGITLKLKVSFDNGYPKNIMCMITTFIQPISRHNIRLLCNLIYDTVFSLKLPGKLQHYDFW